jgi:hypothetical protein
MRCRRRNSRCFYRSRVEEIGPIGLQLKGVGKRLATWDKGGTMLIENIKELFMKSHQEANMNQPSLEPCSPC